MKLKNPMLVVNDIDESVEFYKKVLGLHVVMDFGANKTLTGGLALQTADTYREFIGIDRIVFGGNDSEIYFEEDSVGVQGAIRSMKNKFKPLCRYFRSAYVSVRVVQVPKMGLNLFLHDSQTSTAGISALFKADD